MRRIFTFLCALGIVFSASARTASELGTNMTLVVPPEGLTTEEMPLVGLDMDDAAYETSVQVGQKDGDVYIQGLAHYAPNGWIKGSFNAAGDKVTFASGQYMGESEYGLPVYIMGEMTETGEFLDIVFAYDATLDVYTAQGWIIENAKEDELYYFDVYKNIVIGFIPIIPPTDLVTSEYDLNAKEYYSGEDETYQVKVGFYGNKIYFQGLNKYLPETWVVGQMANDGTVTIEHCYLGTFTSYEDITYRIYFANATMKYYSAADLFTCERFYSYPYDAEGTAGVWEDVTLTKSAGEGIEDIVAEGQAVKVIRNNQVLIIKGDKVYNVFGTVVK